MVRCAGRYHKAEFRKVGLLGYASAVAIFLAQASAVSFVLGFHSKSPPKVRLRAVPGPASAMTVAVLKERLREKGLSTSGLKAVLIERLEEALAQERGYSRLTVSQLKVKCGELGLSKSGRKAELVARLERAVSKEVQASTAGFLVGDKVMALFEDEEEEALVQCHNGDETYLISRIQDGFEHTQKLENMRLLSRADKKFCFSAGDKVQGLYREENKWYPARVKCINDLGSYTIRWEDGEESELREEELLALEVPLALSELRPKQKFLGTVSRTCSFGTFVKIGGSEGLLRPWFSYEGEEPKFKAGDKVLARWEEDEEYYEATVKKDNGDETYQILWDEDGQEDTARKAALKLLRLAELEEGSKVEVMVESVKDEDGQEKLFLATVKSKIGTEGPRGKDLVVFENLGDQWLQGQVTRILPFGAFVKVTSPKGGEAQGLLHSRDLREDIGSEELGLGQELQVRVKYLNVEEGVLQLSMA